MGDTSGEESHVGASLGVLFLGVDAKIGLETEEIGEGCVFCGDVRSGVRGGIVGLALKLAFRLTVFRGGEKFSSSECAVCVLINA